MSGTVADDSKDVLDKIKAEGTFDQMRVQVTEAVKKTVPNKHRLLRCWLLLLLSAGCQSLCAGYNDVSSATTGS